MYTHKNFPTKKALKDAVKAGEKVTVFEPGFQSGKDKVAGTVFLEGPHYPKPHSWYAQATIDDNGVVISVK